MAARDTILPSMAYMVFSAVKGGPYVSHSEKTLLIGASTVNSHVRSAGSEKMLADYVEHPW